MTICIATIAADGKELVFASDSKVGFSTYSADKAITKNVPFIGDYAILFAGNDVAHFGPLLNRSKIRVLKSNTSDPDEIAEVVFEELERERDRISEAQVLRAHLFDLETFKTKGRDLCTESVFYDIHSRLEQSKLSLDVLIVGFDQQQQAHIRFTNSVTPPQDYDALGFWAIGSGAHTALGSLCHAIEYLCFNRYADVEEAVYHALAAKFMAESATDVGRDTFLVAVKAGEKPRFLHPFCGDEFVRKQWKEKGGPRVPKGITDTIKDLLHYHEEALKPEILARIRKYSKTARKIVKDLERSHASRRLVAQTSKPEP